MGTATTEAHGNAVGYFAAYDCKWLCPRDYILTKRSLESCVQGNQAEVTLNTPYTRYTRWNVEDTFLSLGSLTIAFMGARFIKVDGDVSAENLFICLSAYSVLFAAYSKIFVLPLVTVIRIEHGQTAVKEL